MTPFKIGKVIHYYDKINVAVIKLTSDLAQGEIIRFERGGEELFDQQVESMQVEYEKVKEAFAGDTIGIKTTEFVKEGADVYKLISRELS